MRPDKNPHEIVFVGSLSTYLDDDDKSRLEQRWVCCRVHDGRAGLEWLKETTDILTQCKVVAEKDLFHPSQNGLFFQSITDVRDWILPC